ncbi:MAG: HlyD family efflux transporter periplasmic adaptor subunit [Bacteroides sp.]|nr:HlyD family efflux transporter periplasmic adaptor subunit [Bacteroides sp.]
MSNRILTLAFIGLLLVTLIVSVAGLLFMNRRPLLLQGQVEATEIRISGKLPGRIARFYADEGAWVKAGDTLVCINSPLVEAQLRQVTALEEAARQENKKVDAGTRHQIVATAKELWNKSRSDLTLAEATYRRIQALYRDSIATPQRMDEAEALYKAALAAERAAHEQYLLAAEGAASEDRAAARSMVEAAQGSVDEVSALLADAYLTAPADGEIGALFPKLGELVAPGAPIMNLVVMEDVHAVFNVREDLLPRFRQGGTFRADIPATGSHGVEFRIYYISPLGSYATWKSTREAGSYDMRTFEVHARPIREQPGLRPGMSVLLKLER